MKVIVVEGTDNVGKDTVINSIALMYADKSVHIIHCEKPKSSNWAAAAAEQNETFKNYINSFSNYGDDDIIIFNRAWYGEYVYGCMYRHRTDEEVKKMIDEVEERINICKSLLPDFEITYIQLLSSSVELLVRNDDGNSISNKKEHIEKETKRFEDIFNYSSLFYKKLIWVNDGDEFRSREDIMNDVKSILQ